MDLKIPDSSSSSSSSKAGQRHEIQERQGQLQSAGAVKKSVEESKKLTCAAQQQSQLTIRKSPVAMVENIGWCQAGELREDKRGLGEAAP